MNGDRVKNSLIIIGIIFLVFLVYGFYNPKNVNFSANNTPVLNKSSSTKILIVGDIMLDRNVRNLINKMGFADFFKGVKELVSIPDIAVGNLEGPFTTYSSITASLENKALQFTFDPALAPAMADLGFDILGLANNHTLNFGHDGLEMTRRYIGGSGMIYYGDPFNRDEISTIITKNNIVIGLVGFHEFNYINYDKVFSEIARLDKETDVVIVTPHWGEEYEKRPSEKMQKWAHQFIDSGADAIVGAHPHILGDIEIYKGKKIYYSLGNFAFDQYFSEETMQGLAVEMDIIKNGDEVGINYRDIPIRVDREGVRVIEE